MNLLPGRLEFESQITSDLGEKLGYDLKQKTSCPVTLDEPVFAYILMDVFLPPFG